MNSKSELKHKKKANKLGKGRAGWPIHRGPQRQAFVAGLLRLGAIFKNFLVYFRRIGYRISVPSKIRGTSDARSL